MTRRPPTRKIIIAEQGHMAKNIDDAKEMAVQNDMKEESSKETDIPLPMDKISRRLEICSSPDVVERQANIVLLATGSFNPPTYMHIHMFELARDDLQSKGYNVLGGYMSPVNDKFGKKGLLSAEHRIKMCELATADSSFIMVDPWEASQSTYQRTLTVLKRLESSLHYSGIPGTESVNIKLLCGADLLESFTIPGIWIPEQVKVICHDYGVVCIGRGGKDIKKIISGNAILLENERNIFEVDEKMTNDISSSKVRKCLEEGYSVRNLIPDSVFEYIKQHKLYLKQQN